MQNKKTRKAAREVNLSLDPSLKEEGDWIKKNGKRIPKKRRDLSIIIEELDRSIKRDSKDKLPPNVSPSIYNIVKRCYDLAYRTNEKKKEIKCPECNKKFEIELPDVKAEANSISALNSLMDRTLPKLGHITQDINITGYINVVSEYMGRIIVNYVPLERRPEAMAKLAEMFERLIENESGNRAFESPQDNARQLLSGAAG